MPRHRTTAVTGAVTLDSRTVGAGDLFVAVAGERVDGHDFLDAAAAAGAVAALTTRPDGALPCVVVAGPGGRPRSAGRGRAPAADRRRPGHRWASPAPRARPRPRTSSARCSPPPGPPSARPARTTTTSACRSPCSPPTRPPATSCWRWAPAGPGTSPGCARVARPQVGVVLNVGSAHLGEFGSPEGIAAGQGRAGRGAARVDGTAVLNADDPRVLGMRERTRARVVTVGRARRTPTCAPPTSSLDGSGPGRLHPARRGGAAPGDPAGGRASTRSPTRSRPPAPHSRPG